MVKLRLSLQSEYNESSNSVFIFRLQFNRVGKRSFLVFLISVAISPTHLN